MLILLLLIPAAFIIAVCLSPKVLLRRSGNLALLLLAGLTVGAHAHAQTLATTIDDTQPEGTVVVDQQGFGHCSADSLKLLELQGDMTEDVALQLLYHYPQRAQDLLNAAIDEAHPTPGVVSAVTAPATDTTVTDAEAMVKTELPANCPKSVGIPCDVFYEQPGTVEHLEHLEAIVDLNCSPLNPCWNMRAALLKLIKEQYKLCPVAPAQGRPEGAAWANWPAWEDCSEAPDATAAYQQEAAQEAARDAKDAALVGADADAFGFLQITRQEICLGGLWGSADACKELNNPEPPSLARTEDTERRIDAFCDDDHKHECALRDELRNRLADADYCYSNDDWGSCAVAPQQQSVMATVAQGADISSGPDSSIGPFVVAVFVSISLVILFKLRRRKRGNVRTPGRDHTQCVKCGNSYQATGVFCPQCGSIRQALAGGAR